MQQGIRHVVTPDRLTAPQPRGTRSVHAHPPGEPGGGSKACVKRDVRDHWQRTSVAPNQASRAKAVSPSRLARQTRSSARARTMTGQPQAGTGVPRCGVRVQAEVDADVDLKRFPPTRGRRHPGPCRGSALRLHRRKRRVAAHALLLRRPADKPRHTSDRDDRSRGLEALSTSSEGLLCGR